MKKLLALFLLSAVPVFADTPIKNLDITGPAEVKPTGTLSFNAGSKLNVQATVTISASNIDWSLSRSFQKTLAANSTFTFSNTANTILPISVALTNTASNYTVTWPLTVSWPGATAPTQTTGAKTDIYTFELIGSQIYGSVRADFSGAATPTPSPTAGPTGTPTPTPTASPTPTPSPTASPTPTPTPTPSGFVPTDLAGLKLWLKADGLGLSNNDPVTTWTDFSTTSNSATQGTAGNKPVFLTGQINGLPAVRFDGTDDRMSFPNDPGTTTSTFVVGRINIAAGSQQTYATFIIMNTGARLCATLNTSFWGTFGNPGSNVSASEDLVDDAFNVLEITSTAGALVIYRNGVQKNTFAGPSEGNATANYIGADINYLNGDIAEVIVYDTVLSTGDRNDVEDYLATKYGL